MCDLETVPPTHRNRLLTCHTDAALRHAVRTGLLLRPFRGVFVGRKAPGGLATTVRAAQLSIGRELPASLHTAASLLGTGVLDDGLVHLCGPEEYDHVPQRGLRVHSTATPPSTSRYGGILLTGPNRTTLDVARSAVGADALAALDAALRTGLVTTDSLRHEAEAHTGLRGIVNVRRLLDVADGLAESPQESRLRWIILAAGLPVPALQVPVLTPDGAYRLDLAYDEQRLALEYDGVHHTAHDRQRHDRRRHNALDRAGWRVRYFTDVDIYRRPQHTVDQVAELLGLRARPLPVRIAGPYRERGPVAAVTG